jgi:TrbL/VirB6 plasmid conjugal transfer protein
MKNLRYWMIGVAVMAVAFTLMLSLPALAQFPTASNIFGNSFLPTSGQTCGGAANTFGTTTCGWFQSLQGMARTVYIALFTIELMIVAAQGALYKDNIAEFLQTFAFKIIMAAVFLAIIGNAQYIFPVIIQTFVKVAICTTNNGNCNNAAPDYTQPIGDMLGYAAMYFLAADISRGVDSAEAAASGIVVFGTGVPGLSGAFLAGHENFQMFCIALGMTCVMSAAGLLLTFLLLTFETQIVMAIGVIFLAFQGSRFTAQFSQGYFSYAINVGTKFFVFYFMVAILGGILDPNAGSIGASIAGLAAGAAIPFGAGSIALVALTSPIPVICLITSVLVAAIPNFAGSLLQGTSALSASAAMGSQIVTGMAGAVGGGISEAGSVAKGAMSDRANKSAHDKKTGAGGQGGGGAQGGHQGPQDTGASKTQSLQMTPSGGAAPAGAAPGAAAAAAGGGAAPGGPGGALGSEGTMLRPLESYKPEEISAMSSTEANQKLPSSDFSKMDAKQVRAAASKIDYNKMSADQRNDIIYSDKPGVKDAATQGFKDAYSSNLAKELTKPDKKNYADIAAGVAQSMGKGEQPPPAVQVRISNPDKL